MDLTLKDFATDDMNQQQIDTLTEFVNFTNRLPLETKNQKKKFIREYIVECSKEAEKVKNENGSAEPPKQPEPKYKVILEE